MSQTNPAPEQSAEQDAANLRHLLTRLAESLAKDRQYADIDAASEK
ncbi:hypothetical protein AB0D08_03980 [Kitasatospora sp. NPDC048540]